MEFRILGNLEVRADSNVVPLGRPTDLKVLAVLLLDADQMVTVERIVHVLWEDGEPDTARKQVCNAISRLRGVLAAHGLRTAIARRGPGYVLTVADGMLDTRLFEAKTTQAAQAASAGQRVQAAGLLEDALRLWRGPLLAGLTGRAIETAAAAWDERRSAVTETYFEHQLALGRHHEVLSQLGAFVTSYPLREKPVAQLMLALYRCGRQADALAVYAECRKRLCTELGIEPGESLKSLHYRILAADPSLADWQTSPVRSCRQPRSDRGTRRIREFGGIAAELQELRYFVAVAEELHFAHAAARLGIDEQALSSAIGSLEAKLGGQVLERTSRRVHLTVAGQAMLPLAWQAIRAAQRCVEVTKDTLLGVQGHIRLGVCRAARALGDPIVQAMASQFPRVEVEPQIGFLPALFDALHDERLDAVIADCPPADPALTAVRLSDQPAVVALDRNHSLADRAMLRVEDLAGELVVLAPDDVGRHWNLWVLDVFARAGLSPQTVEASGLGRPPGTGPGDVIAISAAIALAWSAVNERLAQVTLSGVTMPFDLVWRENPPSAAMATLVRAALATADALSWPREQACPGERHGQATPTSPDGSSPA